MRNIICCRTVAASLAVCLALTSCMKEYSIIDKLGLLQHTLDLSCDPGSTSITVYADGPWSVALDRQIEWASLNKLSGEGLGEFKLSWAANFGVPREVNVVITKETLRDTIHVIQAGAIKTPYLNLDVSRVMLPSPAREFSVGLTTNLGFCIDEFGARAVYYNGEQAASDTLTVGSDAPGSWIKSYRLEESAAFFSVEENTTGADRRADLIYSMTDAAGGVTRATLSITQSALSPVLSLESSSVDYFSNGQSHTVSADKNNVWSIPEIACEANVDWISDIKVVEEGLTFTTAENLSMSPRSGVITVSGLDAPVTLSVTQAGEKLLSFEELRVRRPGLLSTTDLIEGIIVSDTTSANVCSSVQTGQFEFDRTENERTAYLESVDGSYGFCLKFSDASQNVVSMADRVILRLDGLTLSRELAPQRYTLSGITSDKIRVIERNVQIPAKNLTISQITDADIYTWVSLQKVEIFCKDGCYTNASEGYSLRDELNPAGAVAPRWDVAPLMCSDATGDAIFMLTNAAVPWRRSTDPAFDVRWKGFLPPGAGTLSGVIVSDNVAPVRWGDLGRYQIRAMKAEDIDLNHEADKFSKVICEWTWNQDDKTTLDPDEGKGKLVFSGGMGRDFTSDYNNPYLPQADSIPNGYSSKSNMKGLAERTALRLTNAWWFFEKDENADTLKISKRHIDVEFVTAGISGTNLVLGIVWGHGDSNTSTIYAPSNWDVLCSADGGKTFDLVTTITQRSCAWWTTTSQDATPGFTEHLVKLPNTLFGKSSVVVRFEPHDFVNDIVPATSSTTWQSALGIGRGTITQSTTKESQVVRIGTLSVRYN